MVPIVFGTPEADRIAQGTGRGRTQATPVAQSMVTADGLIAFDYWPPAPSLYATATQLRRAGLKPGGPAVAQVHVKQRRKTYLLYDGRQALPRPPRTSAQQAAVEKAHLARRTCVLCGRVAASPSDLEDMQRRHCWECYEARQLAKRARHYDETVLWARDLLRRDDWVVLDTETTDLHGRIVDLGIVRPDGSVVFETLLNPGEPIAATYIHGITDAMVQDAPTFAQVEPQLRAVLHGKTVVAYNEAYDRGVIQSELWRLYEAQYLATGPDYPGLDAPLADRSAANDRWSREVRARQDQWIAAVDWDCAMESYAQYIGDWNKYYQSYRWQRLPGAGHRAVGDSRACLRLIHRMAASPLSMDVPTEGEQRWWDHQGGEA